MNPHPASPSLLTITHKSWLTRKRLPPRIRGGLGRGCGGELASPRENRPLFGQLTRVDQLNHLWVRVSPEIGGLGGVAVSGAQNEHCCPNGMHPESVVHTRTGADLGIDAVRVCGAGCAGATYLKKWIVRGALRPERLQQKTGTQRRPRSYSVQNWRYYNYIMPPMPPMSPPPGIGASGSGMSVTSAEVERIIAEMEQAFSTALRVTLAGSIMPASSIST